MNSKPSSSNFKLGLALACLFLTQGLWAQSAHAPFSGVNTGCGYTPAPATPIRPQPRPDQTDTQFRSPKLMLIAAHPSDRDSGSATIVGFWKVEFFLPDGTVFDDGYATWHSDGTELMNSGRAPMTGSFCMGAWKQTSQGTYKLNHVALSWDATGTVFTGPANIRETITVDSSGNTYKGTFTLDQYDTNGNVLAHFAGNIIAQRITAD